MSARGRLVSLEPVERERDGADVFDEVIHQRLGVLRRCIPSHRLAGHDQEPAAPVLQTGCQLEVRTACRPSRDTSADRSASEDLIDILLR